MIAIVVQLIGSETTSNETMALTGRVLTAYAELQNWLGGGTSTLDFEGVTRVYVKLTYITRDLYLPWKGYRDAVERNRHYLADVREGKKLVEALEETIVALQALTAGQDPSLT